MLTSQKTEADIERDGHCVGEAGVRGGSISNANPAKSHLAIGEENPMKLQISSLCISLAWSVSENQTQFRKSAIKLEVKSKM